MSACCENFPDCGHELARRYAQSQTCPRCDGQKEVVVHLNRGFNPHDWETMKCRTCSGTGSITGEYALRLEAAAAHRNDRVSRGFSLRDESRRLGMTPAELSEMENPKP